MFLEGMIFIGMALLTIDGIQSSNMIQSFRLNLPHAEEVGLIGIKVQILPH
jgi:hypothetical protein